MQNILFSDLLNRTRFISFVGIKFLVIYDTFNQNYSIFEVISSRTKLESGRRKC